MSCEWNPVTNRPTNLGEKSHAEAKWIIGKGAWRLCSECAKLDFFNRYTYRKWIGELPTPISELPEL